MNIFILAFLLLITNITFAQEDSDPRDITSLSLAELMQIKVTGSTLTPENLKTVPSAVAVFTHREIQRMGLDNLDELMNFVPGFQSYRSSASSLNYPHSARGLSIGSNGAEILVLVDGQRLNDPRTGGSVGIVPKFPLIYIERVEFIRGAGSAVYGSNAMMGIINIITFSKTNRVGFNYGSFNRRKGYLLVSRQMKGVGVNLFGHFDIDDGMHYKTQDGFSPANKIDTDDPRRLTDLKVEIRRNKTQIRIQHYQSESKSFYITNHISNGFNQRRAKFTSVSLKQDFDWKLFTSYVLLGYHVTNVRSYGQLTAPGVLAPISAPTVDDALFASPGFDDYSETRAQWHNTYPINAQNSLQFGIEIRHVDAPEAIAKSNFDIGDLVNGNFPVRYYGVLRKNTIVQTKSKRDIIGIYGQYQRQLFKSSHLTFGLRYDNFSNIGTQLSPRLGFVQELNEHTSLKLLYGEAFRAPSESELNLVNNPVFSGNPDLKPETVQSWDFIWFGQWPHTSFSVGYFENHFGQSIVLTNVGTEKLQYENVEQNPTKGIEFEFSHEFNKQLLVRGTFTRITEKPDLSFREAQQLASLTVNFQRSNWNANLIAAYHGERDMPVSGYNISRLTLNDYWQFLGKLQYTFISNFQGYIQIKNLLGEDYLTPVASANLTEGVPNRGREILVGITRRFKDNKD